MGYDKEGVYKKLFYVKYIAPITGRYDLPLNSNTMASLKEFARK